MNKRPMKTLKITYRVSCLLSIHFHIGKHLAFDVDCNRDIKRHGYSGKHKVFIVLPRQENLTINWGRSI